MSDDLYQQQILQHARDETNRGRMDDADATATVDNPMCGDRVTVDVKLSNGTVAAIVHHTRGCVLCSASAAVLASQAKGQTVGELEAVAAWLNRLLKDDGDAEPAPHWQDLAIFGPVAKHRSRHACVLLPFDAATQALTEGRPQA
jgi:nitrogen fixation NifU-like protein